MSSGVRTYRYSPARLSRCKVRKVPSNFEGARPRAKESPLNLTQNGLAKAIGVPPRRINEIIHGKRAITANTAIRLSLFFGTSAQVWLGLQSEYDLDCILYAERTGNKGTFDFIKRFVPKAAMF